MSNTESFYEALETARIEREHEMAEIVAYFNDLDRAFEASEAEYGNLCLEKV
jgi:hypothetical protein